MESLIRETRSSGTENVEEEEDENVQKEMSKELLDGIPLLIQT